MGLLQEIITGATDGTKPVAELLRSVQVLAMRGGARDLQEWVKKERDGYRDDDVLPSYRGPFSVNPMAHLSGRLIVRSETWSFQRERSLTSSTACSSSVFTSGWPR